MHFTYKFEFRAQPNRTGSHRASDAACWPEQRIQSMEGHSSTRLMSPLWIFRPFQL